MNQYPIYNKIVDILNNEDYLISYPDVLSREAEEAVGNYLSEIERSDRNFQWSMSVSDYPDMSGGAVFLAFIEEGHLFAFSWDYRNTVMDFMD